MTTLIRSKHIKCRIYRLEIQSRPRIISDRSPRVWRPQTSVGDWWVTSATWWSALRCTWRQDAEYAHRPDADCRHDALLRTLFRPLPSLSILKAICISNSFTCENVFFSNPTCAMPLARANGRRLRLYDLRRRFRCNCFRERINIEKISVKMINKWKQYNLKKKVGKYEERASRSNLSFRWNLSSYTRT